LKNLEGGDRSRLPGTVALCRQEVRSDALGRRRERKKRVTKGMGRKYIYRGRLTQFLSKVIRYFGWYLSFGIKKD
jgi:hypothetical protein